MASYDVPDEGQTRRTHKNSNFAFHFQLAPCHKAACVLQKLLVRVASERDTERQLFAEVLVGRCRIIVSKPEFSKRAWFQSLKLNFG